MNDSGIERYLFLGMIGNEYRDDSLSLDRVEDDWGWDEGSLSSTFLFNSHICTGDEYKVIGTVIVIEFMWVVQWKSTFIWISRNIHIHECTVTSDNRCNRGQNRSNLSSSINGMVHIRDNSVYSLKFGRLMMS